MPALTPSGKGWPVSPGTDADWPVRADPPAPSHRQHSRNPRSRAWQSETGGDWRLAETGGDWKRREETGGRGQKRTGRGTLVMDSRDTILALHPLGLSLPILCTRHSHPPNAQPHPSTRQCFRTAFSLGRRRLSQSTTTPRLVFVHHSQSRLSAWYESIPPQCHVWPWNRPLTRFILSSR